MLSLLKSLGFIRILMGLITISLILFKAAWPLAIIFIATGSLEALKTYLDSKKSLENDSSLKDRLSAMENKMTMMGLRK